MYYKMSLISHMNLNKEVPVTSVNVMNPDTHKSMVLVASTGLYGISKFFAFDIMDIPWHSSHSPCIIHIFSPSVIHRTLSISIRGNFGRDVHRWRCHSVSIMIL